MGIQCTPSTLRHTWVSMHAARGTPQAVIQDSVGHSNPAMTAHYTHVSEATARDVALALPAFTATDANTPALPTPQADIRGQVRALAGKSEIPDKLPAGVVKVLEGMNARNWSKVRDELLNRNPA